ncbi:MAG: ABC-ATPase domain-containing protein [Methanomassiliicoccaceae archaeon]|jgi:predicted ABC-class ATPase|nr:ABC-ATPase domain-containing protein [Methanomassiliicoccaceae archaeon]
MTAKDDLIKFLRSIDGRPYQRYGEMARSYDLDGITLYADRVQNEMSSSSDMRVRISFARSGFPDDTHDSPVKEIALRDLIARRFWESCRTFAKGGAHGGSIYIPRPGQEMLERSSVVFSRTFIEVRFRASLPAAGRNAAGNAAVKMLTEDLGEITKTSLFYNAYKQSKLYNHINTLITARTIRSSLRERGLVGFVADGSVMPRREDGAAPMADAAPFSSPDALAVTFTKADGTEVRGMGIPEGLTAVIGATGQGKSTLMRALAAGVYDHIPGDGRELVITADDAVEIYGDAGRTVRSVDVSLFMSDASRNTRSLSTDDADRATSSAVSASEAIEAGCRLLLMNDLNVHHGIMYRDAGIAAVIPKGDEVMIPVTEGLRGSDISAVIVCRHMPEAADTMIITSGHNAIGAILRERAPKRNIIMPADRIPMSRNMVLAKGRKEVSSVAVSVQRIEAGEKTITFPPQLADICQTAAVADALADSKDLMDGTVTLRDAAKRLEDTHRKRINSTDINAGPDRAAFRMYDIAAVINRHPDIVFAQRS